jgi:hypothetical protein
MAMTMNSLLSQIKEVFSGPGESIETRWAHPFLRIAIMSPRFSAIDPEDRDDEFGAVLGVEPLFLRAFSSRTFVRWELLAPGESISVPARGTSWLDVLSRSRIAHPRTSGGSTRPPKFVHFYGFKGGQGRSTALALVARALAADGWRVLVADFDVEAPSLEIVLGATTKDLHSTILGIRMGTSPRPTELGVTPRGGSISLLPFRPDEKAYDFDAAALAFEFQNFPPAADAISRTIETLSTKYDVVLIDHRTGLGPVVPTIAQELAGPLILFARLDGQSRNARQYVSSLWSTSVDAGWSGMLVSMSPLEETPESFKERTKAEAEELLQGLADALGTGEDGEPRDAQELHDNWIVFPFDQSLARNSIVSSTPSLVTDGAIRDLRRVLTLTESKTAFLAKSGSRDEGDLIVTQALRKLQSRNNPYTLIVGRKGTGKTRLLRTLAQAGLGSPLMVPTDFPEKLGGARAGHLQLKPLIERFRSRPDFLWYTLLTAALTSGTELTSLLANAWNLGDEPSQILSRLIELVKAPRERETFLIDGLESAFEHGDTFPFVRGLFRALETIDGTPELSAVAQFRIFVRRDLVDKGIQNREQMEAGRRIDLVWDVQSILNFALSRVARIDWYRAQFPDVVQDIEKEMDRVLEGQVTAQECEQLMLRIFPAKLSYKNISTITFLRTYFSDDSEGETSFYPRVYMSFLEEIPKLSKEGIVKGRIDSNAIVQAHQRASEAFLDEVSQELAHAAAVDAPTLKRVFDQLDAKKTPFDVDELVNEVSSGAQIPSGDVRNLFNTMKQLGIFEEYPKRPNQWRPGRLFKTALKMRFFSGAG